MIAAGDQFTEVEDRPGEGALDHGHPMDEPVRNAGDLLRLGHLRGERRRDRPLIGVEEVDGKAARVADRVERPCPIREADEGKQGLEGERAERVRGHPPGSGRTRGRDHGDPGREPAEHLAEDLWVALGCHRGGLYRALGVARSVGTTRPSEWLAHAIDPQTRPTFV